MADDRRGDDDGMVGSLAEGLSEKLVDLGIDGMGPLDSAKAVANRVLATTGSREAAVKELTGDHIKLAGASGFLTNLGGFTTMVASLPANLVTYYAIATRLAASIAHVYGHDLDDPVVRATVLLTLTRDDAGELMEKAGRVPGIASTTSLPLRMVLRQMPESTVGMVNKGVAFTLVKSLVGKGVARFGRFLPLVGGAVGAGLDALLMRQVGKAADEEFSATEPAWYEA